MGHGRSASRPAVCPPHTTSLHLTQHVNRTRHLMHEETELGGLDGRPSFHVPASQTVRLQPRKVSRPVSSQTCPHAVSEALQKGRGLDKENGLCSLRDTG